MSAVALTSYAITSLNAVKGYLKRPLTDDNDNDDWLITQINIASGICEQYCQRVFTIQSFSDELHNGNGRSRMRTLYYPITQLSTEASPSDAQKLAAVQYRDDVNSAWQNIETDVDNIIINNPPDYLLSPHNSHNIELLEETFPLGTRTVKLSYKAGLSGVALAEIEQLVIEMVVTTWKESGRGQGTLGQSQMTNSAGGNSENITIKNLKPEWKEVLNRYKRNF
jgi:hypothetical protein